MVWDSIKRLVAEYKQISKNPIDNVAAGPKSESNYLEWEVVLVGPENSMYENGYFIGELIFKENYPIEPPIMRFKTKILHPNIYSDGRVCISILHSPGDDPYGYEHRLERWSPVISVEKILVCVINMLCEPNFDSPANVDASKLWRENEQEFKKIAKKYVDESLIYEL